MALAPDGETKFEIAPCEPPRLPQRDRSHGPHTYSLINDKDESVHSQRLRAKSRKGARRHRLRALVRSSA
jgi:hypothetical protein